MASGGGGATTGSREGGEGEGGEGPGPHHFGAAHFSLRDLWESFDEWSAYGVEAGPC